MLVDKTNNRKIPRNSEWIRRVPLAALFCQRPADSSCMDDRQWGPLSTGLKTTILKLQESCSHNYEISTSQVSDKDGVLSPQHRMIPYPLPDTSSEPSEISKKRGHHKFPLEVALTPFHLAMVFYDRLRIICTVNQQLVYEDTYDQVGQHSWAKINVFFFFSSY